MNDKFEVPTKVWLQPHMWPEVTWAEDPVGACEEEPDIGPYLHPDEVNELRLAKARVEASNAMLLMGLAEASRLGFRDWAVKWKEKADEAALTVKLEDLVVARVATRTGEG